ncbi:MAG TPA: phosphotransferase [Ktedonobacteraceae bacterium]|nr:phosphotransferase [Ktedonobacteraceae bacterium]
MIDVDKAIALIQRNFPKVTIQAVHAITRGWDSFVLDVNDALIFRFPLREDVIAYIEKEKSLLPVLEPALSTPIPHFDYVGHGDASYPFLFVGYRKLVGIPLEDENITSEQLIYLGPALGTFLSELHSFPVARAIQAGVQDHTPEQWRERYWERYVDLQKRVFPLLDMELRTKSAQLWEDFLDNRAIFAFQPVLIHCDLACEHIFCDPEHSLLTGVIDWGDATIGDPALDFVGLHQGHGRAFTERVLEDYRGMVDAAFWQRMDFYLCYGPFSELLFGAYSESEKFIAQGIEGLRKLFDV